MKKIFLSLLTLFFTSIAFAQNDSIQPPYKRFPSFPPVKLLLPDSTTYFTKADLDKKKPTMLMLFNPQCEHCQHETGEIIKNIDKFKDIQIVMATSMLFDSMFTFREKYNPNFFLVTYFMIRNLPFLAFYDKKKELISVFEGSLPIDKVLKEFEK